MTTIETNTCITKTFDCCDPWFTHIKEKRKVIEGRLCNQKYSDLIVGNIIKLLKSIDSEEYILVKIISITKYNSFREMLEKETLEKVLPDPSVKTIDDGVKIYRSFYTEKLEIKKGVLAIGIELID